MLKIDAHTSAFYPFNWCSVDPLKMQLHVNCMLKSMMVEKIFFSNIIIYLSTLNDINICNPVANFTVVLYWPAVLYCTVQCFLDFVPECFLQRNTDLILGLIHYIQLKADGSSTLRLCGISMFSCYKPIIQPCNCGVKQSSVYLPKKYQYTAKVHKKLWVYSCSWMQFFIWTAVFTADIRKA